MCKFEIRTNKVPIHGLNLCKFEIRTIKVPIHGLILCKFEIRTIKVPRHGLSLCKFIVALNREGKQEEEVLVSTLALEVHQI